MADFSSITRLFALFGEAYSTDDWFLVISGQILCGTVIDVIFWGLENSYADYFVYRSDVCEDSPCLHGGMCIKNQTSPSGFTCQCTEGFIGQTCEGDVYDCNSNPCQNQGKFNLLIVEVLLVRI